MTFSSVLFNVRLPQCKGLDGRAILKPFGVKFSDNAVYQKKS